MKTECSHLLLHATRRFRRIPVAVLSVFAMLLMICGTASAQLAGKGEIRGTVGDPTGAAIPGASVVVTNTATGVSSKTTSTSAGDYSMSTLDPGVYTVTISAKGFETLTQKNVSVNALETQTFNPKLTVGASSETVEVSTAPPQLETTNATLGATMEQEMYAALPIQMGAFGQPDQRRATDFAQLMPGVQGNETNGNATTNTGVVNGSGSRGAASAVYIDGVPFTQVSGEGDPRFVWTAISVDAVEQFQVQTSGYSALYEGQGVQNYTVKSGGNRFHGAVYEFLRNTALDTWGFYKSSDPISGKQIKSVEHQNEYGINLSGPLVPFGSWRDKVFFFGNYNGFRYSHSSPQKISFPSLAERTGDFSAVGVPIYDPNTQTECTANSTDGPCRYQYGYGPGEGTGSRGNPILTGTPNVIPSDEFSQVALNMQTMLPTNMINTNATNNYLATNYSALSNWSTTDRIDYTLGTRDTLAFVAALGRQASSVPVGQTTAGRNTGPVPYNFGQAYAPKTAVGIIEETHTFSPQIVNQLKYGFARYNGPTINADEGPAFAATAMGITGLPTGQAQQAFPAVTFAGTSAPTNWAGEPASVSIANSYTLLDNLQWNFGKHSLTVGGELAWLQYQMTPASGGSSPLTIAAAVTETAALNASSNAKPAYAATANTGLAYASFLIGQVDKGSLSQYVVPEFGARFRPISPYIQDNWKVSSRLTLDLGLRYDFYPTYREAHDNMAFFNPNLANPITGQNGALQYAGTGTNTCNCRTPVNDYYKNFGPRIGIAFQSDPKTVWRASYGVMFTHGDGVGGAANSRTGTGTLGFTASPSFSANGQLLSTFPLSPGNTAFPAYQPALGRASGPAYGTGYTTTSGYTGSPASGAGYGDPYLGGRAPEYINWSFGFQHQWTSTFTSTISYVGSEGHFLITDGGNPRGLWADALDPKYLSLGSALSSTGATELANCATDNLPCPANFNTSQALSTALKPFPFNSVSDTYGNVANSIYHGLQVSLMKRPSHGLTIMANYTWSRAIDDGGTFRTGYPIPAAFIVNATHDYKADALERTVSTSNQPQHIVFTGVWDLPFGRSLFGGQAWQRAVFGGFKFSGIAQAYSGSPLAITGASCGTNPAQSTCLPVYNPAYSGSNPRINGKWGKGVALNPGLRYVDPSAFATTPAYMFSNLPRTAPYNIYGPGNYDIDISLRRSFGLHINESTKLDLQADLYNVTNHTQFGGIGLSWSSASSSNFGQVSSQANVSRDAQLSARVEF